MSGMYDQSIIDETILEFLDAFQEVYERPPTAEEYGLWKMGFIAGCQAIRIATEKYREST